MIACLQRENLQQVNESLWLASLQPHEGVLPQLDARFTTTPPQPERTKLV